MKREIIVDNFAGGGGASIGIGIALGRSVDVAINHDPVAIAMHCVNHPDTYHYCEDVWAVDPRQVVQEMGNHPVALCWLSPDCKHFSKAKGGKPVEKHIRGLAWVAVRWAATVRPRVIILENVEEFKTWGPLLENGKPDAKQKGRTFNAFINALKRQGYRVEWRELRACDYGAPTIRKRLFLIARCDGQRIVWPEPTHGDPARIEVAAGIKKPWRTAAEIIDWSLPCPSIFERKRPLAENTMRRIARGIQRFVIDNPRPFIIPIAHYNGSNPAHSIDEPLKTITAYPRGGHFALVSAFLSKYHGERGPEDYNTRGQLLNESIRTVDTSNRFSLVTAHLAKHYGGGYTGPGASMDEPLPTVTTKDHNALITSHLIKLRGTCQHGAAVTDPAPTVTAGGLHIGEVRAFLLKYYGTGTGQNLNDPAHTVTTKDRIGLVTVHGEDYQIVDIGMRMLEPHELFAAQGFPADYIIDRDDQGNRFSKAQQVALCGNSVPPDLSRVLVESNLPELCAAGGKPMIIALTLAALFFTVSYLIILIVKEE